MSREKLWQNMEGEEDAGETKDCCANEHRNHRPIAETHTDRIGSYEQPYDGADECDARILH